MAFVYDAPDSTDTENKEDYEKSTPELDPDALLIRFKSWWREDQPHCKLWHTDAKLDFAFRAGDQWPDEDKQYMEDAQKRACLTFNQIDPVIDAVIGSEITNRQEVRYIPRQMGPIAGGTNEVLSEAARWFRDQCDAEHEDSAAFGDAATCGMGWTETRVDYEENPNGDPKIEKIDPMEMYWDAAAKQANLTDARRFWRVQRKMPLNTAQMKWPNGPDGMPIEDDDMYDARWASDDSEDESPYEVHTPGDPLQHEGEPSSFERTVTIVQAQWYETEDYFRAQSINPTSGQMQSAEFTPEQHMIVAVRAAELGWPYRAVRQKRKIYWQAFIGSEVLEVRKLVGPPQFDGTTKRPGKPATNFNFCCITGKWDRNKGHFYGLVRSMRGPQTFANKWLSTTVEIMARAAKGGLMLEETAVGDVEKFEEDWAKPGANAYFQAGAITGGRVQPKPATQFPNDFMSMTQFAIASIRDVTGVNAETLGMAQQDQPASLEYQRRQSATVILAPLFDSLRRYRRIQGRVLLFLITEYLTDGRLIRIVGPESEQYVPFLKQPGVTEYDVIVDDAPSSPSQKELVWNSLVQMLPLLQNMQLPPQVMMTLFEYSPMPNSVMAKVKAQITQAQQNAPPPPPDPMTLIMQEKQADIQADQAKKAADIEAKRQQQLLDVGHQRALAQIELLATMETERIKADTARSNAATQLESKRQEQAMKQADMLWQAQQERGKQAEQDARVVDENQRRGQQLLEPVMAHMSQQIAPINDIIMQGLKQLADAHTQGTTMMLTELRKPRKRTLVRGQDGRATHAIEEVSDEAGQERT